MDSKTELDTVINTQNNHSPTVPDEEDMYAGQHALLK